MARRSQCSSAGDNPLDPNYLPPHYREEYRLAIDALIEEDLEGYYQFLQKADVVDFLSSREIEYIQSSVEAPQLSSHPEQPFLDTGVDGSSDTYWPIHSDLDAPGLDLGWPQLHHFIGPTEVTTLVNPPEPDMPSIKEQARRLIKNAQQVIAIVMDMFTDVDMFADILNAATRKVAVYILLDKQNVHHFVNMVSSCRVDLQSIQFLRVRTVSGITYHCRTGKSLKGQMMDRFLLTDCRAVLSGNYSFMWSYEKLHRCMAHLFLGQLVSTFDEEFRILYAQSQPLMIENVPAPVEDFRLLQKRPYHSEITSLYREPRKFLSVDAVHPDDWARHSYDERMNMDRRMMPLKRQEAFHGPADMYSRFPGQQSRLDPPFDQGPSRVAMMDNPAFKRHSYAEGVHGRYSFPFLQQQGMPEPENQGRQFHRRQQPYPGPGPGPGPGKEADYSGYDKFWNQDYHSGDQYSDPGLPQDMDEPDNFDPVLKYLSSTRNVDFDQGSEKLPPAADLPLSSSHPRRLSLGQTYACQTSPTPLNPPDQKQFFQEANTDRKDPTVKQGLRNWRISSYLSAYDNPGDEGMPLPPPIEPDPFEEPSNPIQQTAPGMDLSFPKIPNVREFKVPAIPRASQMPSYAKTAAREQKKKSPDEPTAVAAEAKATPATPESLPTTEGAKPEEAELKEPKAAVVQRGESFRRNYNAAVQRSSRLRSSLIFGSLDQQNTPQDNKTAPGQPDQESDKNEGEQTKLPLGLGQRRSTAREPFEWSRFMKSATFDNSPTDPSKPDDGKSKTDDKDSSEVINSKDLSEDREVEDSVKLPDVEQANSSPSVPKPSEAELPKTDPPAQPPKSLLTTPVYVDMSDPDARLMFFKELAAKRKSEKAAEAEKSKEKAPVKPPTEPVTKEKSEKVADTSATEDLSGKNAAAEDVGKTDACGSVSLSLHSSDETNKEDTQDKTDPETSQSCKQDQTRVSTDSEKVELKSSHSAATLPISAETEAPQSKTPAEPELSNPAVKTSGRSHPPTPTTATPANAPSPVSGTDESESPRLDSTSMPFGSVTPSSEEAAPSSALASLSTPAETISSVVTPKGSSSTLTSPDAQETVSPPAEPSQSAEGTSISQTESTQARVDSVPQVTSPKTPSAVDSAQTDIPPDTYAAGSEPNASSSQSTAKTDSEESCAPAPSEKDAESESNSIPKGGEESEVLGSSKDVKSDGTPPTLSPSRLESCLPKVSDLESKSTSDQNETTTPTPSPETSPPAHSSVETSSPVHPDFTPNASQSETTASPQDAPIRATPPSELKLTGAVAPPPAKIVSGSSPQTESVESGMSPKAEKSSHSPSDTNSLLKQASTDSSETPMVPSKEICSPTEPTSKVPAEPDQPCKTPESVTPDLHPSEPPVPAEDSKVDAQNEVSKEAEMPDPDEKKTDDTQATNKVNETTAQKSVSSEKTNDQLKQNNCSKVPETTPDEVVAPSPQSKQPKSSQSRYHTSTANVLSSSNLRDDTKLLLEQISANNQSRNEATKESPVTDDEKEDEADKNAKMEKERGIRSLNRGQPKSCQERDKLLEKLQSMRKERKVYSRFEMAP